MRNLPPSSSSASSSIGGERYRLLKPGEKFWERAIVAALRGRSCPICLENLTGRRAAVITTCKHGYCLACIRKWSSIKRSCPLCNTNFDSWFIVSDLALRKYRKEQLPILRNRETLTYHRRNNPSGHRRIIQRSGDVLGRSSSRSRPLPWRRSFGRLGSVPDHIIFERKLRWRASIYDRQLRAVGCLHSRPSLELVDDQTKARVIERIEPWIRRELHAVLGDPDPSIIVHFASALFIKRLERENSRQSGQTGMLVEDEDSSLRRFLFDKEDIFWHELRCFAESSLTMETYDAVVEYNEVE
ncbi:E3 ubiquitin-protein ligase Topors [Eutrema salsugineum]|uniref:E3 ubiquitin-protein ligase Topors n=1 Tax=Eutrema salsugineum TaxID=72664 RepID=UPI000CECED1E|nr:E3 ubiquitin-protein ligase Topors [Eutrema salsugineum]